MSEINIRPFQAADLEQVLLILRAALGETPALRRTPELWAWKHELNPFGPSLVLVAEAENRIAGVRAFMRWELALPGGIRLRCLRPVDTATHPDFERRGIFRQLTTAAVEQAREEGVDLIFNTPNPRSGAGYLTMGWQEVGRIGVQVRPLLRRGSKPESEVPDPGEFFDPVATEVPGEWPEPRTSSLLRTPRSSPYLAWRFSGHPSVTYRAILHDSSLAVVRPNLRSGRKEVVVSDLLGQARGAIVRKVAASARAHYLAGWFSPGTPERKAAIAGGMFPVPRVRSLTLVANPLQELPVDVFDLANWDLALSDLELL